MPDMINFDMLVHNRPDLFGEQLQIPGVYSARFIPLSNKRNRIEVELHRVRADLEQNEDTLEKILCLQELALGIAMRTPGMHFVFREHAFYLVTDLEKGPSVRHQGLRLGEAVTHFHQYGAKIDDLVDERLDALAFELTNVFFIASTDIRNYTVGHEIMTGSSQDVCIRHRKSPRDEQPVACYAVRDVYEKGSERDYLVVELCSGAASLSVLPRKIIEAETARILAKPRHLILDRQNSSLYLRTRDLKLASKTNFYAALKWYTAVMREIDEHDVTETFADSRRKDVNRFLDKHHAHS
jgi:hypothetical protein